MKKHPVSISAFVAFLRSPDAGGEGGGSTTPPATPAVRKAAIPRADADLATLADLASAKWLTMAALTLVWTNATDFRALVVGYLAGLQARRDAGAVRPATTQNLNELVALVEDAGEEVKVYIRKKYKKDGAGAQFPRFGLVRRNNRWEMPADRDDLKTSLESMKNAIAADGFGTEEYGTPFWTEAQTRFNQFFQQAKTIDADVSDKASAKNADKAQIRKALKCIYKLIEANYPDDTAAVLRTYGYQKEDY